MGGAVFDFEPSFGSVIVTPPPADTVTDALVTTVQDGTGPGSFITTPSGGANTSILGNARNTTLVSSGENDVDFLDTEGGVGGFVADIFFIKKGDLSKAIEIELVGDTLAGVATSDIRFIMKDSLKGPPAPVAKIDSGPTGITITSVTAPATIEYKWQSGDTDTPGTFFAEFEVDFGGARGPETFPNDDHIEIRIVTDLGGQF